MFYNKYNSIAIIIASSLALASPCYSQNVFQTKTKESAADSILNNTISNNPNSKTAKIICAKVYIKNGNYLEAEKLLMQVLEEDPTNTKANKLLKDLNSLITNNDTRNSSIEIKDINIKDIPIPQVIKKDDNSSKEVKFENDYEEKPTLLTPEKIEKLVPKNKEKKEISNAKLPTKEEILKRAKAKKLAEKKEESQPTENAPLAIQAPNKNHKTVTQISDEEKSSNDKVDYIEPIIIRPMSENNTSEESSLPEKKTLIYR